MKKVIVILGLLVISTLLSFGNSSENKNGNKIIIEDSGVKISASINDQKLPNNLPKPIIEISCDRNKETNETSLYKMKYKDVTYVANRNGQKESAIKFNGGTEIKVAKNINPDVMPNLTVTFWAKPDFDNKQMTILSHDDGGYDRAVTTDSRGNGRWEWSAYCSQPLGATKINKDKWTFVGVSFNQKTQKVLICIDGKFYEKNASASNGLDYFHIGNNPSFGEPYFGLLDEIKIFNQSLTRDAFMKLFVSEGGTVDRSDQYLYTEKSNKADILIRVGDVDNLNLGWAKGFDPFCGMNTSIHDFPWTIDENDYKGTDKIMVVSSYKSGESEGYTSSTSRPDNLPESIVIKYKKPKIAIQKVVLQMMLDDFQAPVMGTSFQFHINGKRLTYVEDVINKLNQSGPTGKLVQVGLLPEDNYLLETGNISIKIDDPITGAGDGFAIDFIQILINPKGEYSCIGNIKGVVKDNNGTPLKDVLISANGLEEALTKNDGSFNLQKVPIGLITLTANKATYSHASVNFELNKDENKVVNLILKNKTLESSSFIDKELKEKGFVNLYGIHYDSGKDTPNSKSEASLKELAKFLKSNEDLKIQIIGHTDSEGDDDINMKLSLRRAQSVINWLKSHNVNVSNITAKGLGESSPIASNKTSSGKALNRRVEILIIK